MISTPAGAKDPTFADASAKQTAVSELSTGTYVLRLTLTDNDGKVATDDVKITVSPAASVPCAAGSTWSATGKTPCESCTSSSACVFGVASTCVVETDTVCDVACVAGSTWSASGVSPCASCSADSTCSKGVAQVCTKTSDTECTIACVPGSTWSTSGASPCATCAPDSTCALGIQTPCTASSDTTCKAACIVGTSWSSTGASPCSPCTATNTCSNGVASQCETATDMVCRVTCIAGQGWAVPNKCVACAAGKFSDTEDGEACKPHSTERSCIIGEGLVAGTSVSDTKCEACAAGTYSNSNDASPCKAHDAGLTCVAGKGLLPGSVTADVSCGDCVKGTSFSAATGKAACELCKTCAHGFKSECTTTKNSDCKDAKVTGVGSPLAAGTYGEGSEIEVRVRFSDTVTVSGAPSISLKLGNTPRAATFSGGSGTSSIIFQYVIAAGDTSSDLGYTSTNALTLNGGAITSDTGRPALISLPVPGAAGSLSVAAAIVVDTSTPVSECLSGYHLVDSKCLLWKGTCTNGQLAPVVNRTKDGQCGSCSTTFYLSANVYQCSPCTATNTCSNGVASQCETATDMVCRVTCIAGQGWAVPNKCVACAAGKFSDTEDGEACKPHSTERSCIIGEGLVAGTSVSDTKCEACAAGTYSNSNDASPCKAHDAGLTCVAGKGLLPGSVTADVSCGDCVKGTSFSAANDWAACEKCATCAIGVKSMCQASSDTECKTLSCDPNPCQFDGVCALPTNVTELEVNCRCQIGYFGSECEFDACTNVECGANGRCKSGTCLCDPGYEGKQCGTTTNVKSYFWHVGNWAVCSSNCNGGTQSRSRECRATPEIAGGAPTVETDVSRCAGFALDMKRPCNTMPCGDDVAHVTLKLDGSFAKITASAAIQEAFVVDFVNDVSNALGIASIRVRIDSLTAGSIVVSFSILPDETGKSSVSVQSAADELQRQGNDATSCKFVGIVLAPNCCCTFDFQPPMLPSLAHPVAIFCPTSRKEST